jgi:hypothetical protein
MTALDRSSYAAPPRRRMRVPRYISGTRLHEILRDRLGCSPTGERDLFSAYWVAPDGTRFRVLDPIIDPSGSYAMCSDGKWQRVYSIQYARRLVAYLMDRMPPQPEPQRAEFASIDAPPPLPYRRLDIKV